MGRFLDPAFWAVLLCETDQRLRGVLVFAASLGGRQGLHAEQPQFVPCPALGRLRGLVAQSFSSQGAS